MSARSRPAEQPPACRGPPRPGDDRCHSRCGRRRVAYSRARSSGQDQELVPVPAAEVGGVLTGRVPTVSHQPRVCHVRRLTAGVIAAPARRTVRGMLADARMAGVWQHHSRAHRFFATARWSLDHVGLIIFGLVVGWLTAAGAPLLVAVDDTPFRRGGRYAYGACRVHDGSRKVAAGQRKLFRGTTFVIAAVVVNPPFARRPIARPVLFRL
ncbi:transposase [Amycolatopsis panacis]|uniref:Transposase IS701-like DDE domain-containing protein n=1 Tax=Amycolatopsis panacis TaxID=2340917 RepID=A0A419I705_9PSEU|nr:transposase [Amycolatopsis panacis]RJQ87233.1 hypothetical protein D5S19_09860 [Amycolatopsis panacis]